MRLSHCIRHARTKTMCIAPFGHRYYINMYIDIIYCTYIAIFKRHTYTHTYIYISRYVCVCILYTLQLKNQTCHLLTLSPFLSLSARLSSDHFQTHMDGFRWRDPLDGPPKIVLGDQPKVASDDVWESFSCISLWFALICKLHWNQRRLFSWTVSHLQAVCRSWRIKQQKNHIEGLVSWKFQPPKMQIWHHV